VKIVVLDGYPINPGDLDWSPMEALGPLTVYDRSASHDVVERAQGSEIVLTNKVVISRGAITQLPVLKYIGVLATGYNIVDVKAAREKGIVVTNIPAYSRDSVVQLVFALALELVAHTSDHLRAVEAGRWISSPDWSFTVAPVRELAGKTLGIIGMGAIGKKVALVGHAFGMNVIASGTPSQRPVELTGFQVQRYSVDEVLEMSDVVTLHCPLTNETKLMINAGRIARMKPTSILINTARGQLIDEHALADALSKGVIAGVGLDVLSVEPPHPNNALLHAPRCLITPHIAWASVEARRRLMQIAVENIRAFIEGKSQNVIE
jgi:glycerate dehydrogenase